MLFADHGGMPCNRNNLLICGDSVIRLKPTHPLFAIAFVFTWFIATCCIAQEDSISFLPCRDQRTPPRSQQRRPENIKDVNENGNSFYPPDTEGSDPNTSAKSMLEGSYCADNQACMTQSPGIIGFTTSPFYA